MLGRNTQVYRKCIDTFQKYKNMEHKLEIAALGSTMTEHDLDFSMWSGRGFNFALAPQTLHYDFKLLKQYHKYLNKNAIVLISLGEYSLLVDEYKDDTRNYKYYWLMDHENICNYKKSKEFFVKKFPGIINIRLVKEEVKSFLFQNKKYDCTLRNDSENMMKWWKEEFALEEGFDKKKAALIKKQMNLLKEMIDFCEKHEFRPVILIPPVCKLLKEKLSDGCLRECLWEPLEEIKLRTDVIDFFHREGYGDSCFQSSILLNEKGKERFNKSLISEINHMFGKEFVYREMENTYVIHKVELSWIAFGTGVIWRYSRNIPLFLKLNVLGIVSSLKHRKLSRELYGNLHIHRILKDAYECGFRMFDSGRIYGYSEKMIGKLAKEKEDLVLTTKCSAMDVERKGSPNSVEGNLRVSLQNFNRKNVEILMLHWPEGENWLKYYEDIIKEYQRGRCLIFGACNMRLENLSIIEQKGLPLPMIIQTEIHPLNTQIELRDYCEKHKIQLMAHTPTARLDKAVMNNLKMRSLSEKYHKSTAQIILRWHFQNGIIPVVSCFKKEHMRENLNVFDFTLSDDEMRIIENMNQDKFLLDTRGIDDPNYRFNN